MSGRLSTIAPDLVAWLGARSPSEQREVATRVVESATLQTKLRDPRLDAAIAALHAEQFGDTQPRRHVQELEEELDELAWDTQDGVNRGESTKQDYLAAFARARTASAVWSALDDNPAHAAEEATYEAMAAVGEDEIRHIVGA